MYPSLFHLSLGLACSAMIAGCGKGFLQFSSDTSDTAEDGSGTSVSDGLGINPDSRLTANLYTWGCVDGDRRYLGTYGLELTLEYAPDGLQDLVLPEAGECVADVSMFPQDAGTYGTEIPNAEPRWDVGWAEGDMDLIAPGFYHADVLGNQRSCTPPGSVLTQGVSIEDAGNLEGVEAQDPGDLEIVSFDGENTQLNQGIDFGSELTLSWEASGWDSSWIQLRQERSGYAYGSVTCNTTGQDSFLIDDEVWSLLDQDLNVETLNLFVGFQNDGELELESGLKSKVLTRAIHVAVLED